MEHGAGGEALLFNELPIDGPSPPAQDQRGCHMHALRWQIAPSDLGWHIQRAISTFFAGGWRPSDIAKE